MRTLVETLARYAFIQPDSLFAVDDKGMVCTYAEAWNIVKILTYRLNQFLVDDIRENRCQVLVKCNQGVEYLLTYLACNLTNVLFVPVEKNASDERVKEIAEETECKFYINHVKDERFCACITYEELFQSMKMDFDYDVTFPGLDDISEILYTTGTTGKCKGIVMTHGANIALAENVKYGVNMRRHNIELIPLVMSHSHGLRTFYANLLNGGAVIRLCQ